MIRLSHPCSSTLRALNEAAVTAAVRASIPAACQAAAANDETARVPS
jgi:hypothetical protein